MIMEKNGKSGEVTLLIVRSVKFLTILVLLVGAVFWWLNAIDKDKVAVSISFAKIAVVSIICIVTAIALAKYQK